MPVYLVMMDNLHETHPDAHELLLNGDLFTIQRSSNSFGRIPVDQTVESTINRDVKSKGGIIGQSLNPGAVFKWNILRSDRGQFTQHCCQLTGEEYRTNTYSIKDAGATRIVSDESSVNDIITTVNE